MTWHGSARQLRNDPGNILGVARPAKEKSPLVSLGKLVYIFDKSSRRAQTNNEHSRRQRIKRTGMPGFDRPHQPLNPINDISRRHSRRLIDIEKTEHRSIQTEKTRGLNGCRIRQNSAVRLSPRNRILKNSAARNDDVLPLGFREVWLYSSVSYNIFASKGRRFSLAAATIACMSQRASRGIQFGHRGSRGDAKLLSRGTH